MDAVLDSALIVARLLLAVVFVVAGLAKLADWAGSRQAIVDFGVPHLLAGPVGVLLPLAELAVAAALIFTASAWWGALGAAGLLLLFIVGISLNLARGRTPSCRCFGQISAGPVGRRTLIRNALLLVVAAFVVVAGRAAPGPSIVGWLNDATVAERVLLSVGVVGLALLGGVLALLVQVIGQQGRILLRLDELEAKVLLGDGAASSAAGGAASVPEGLPVGTPAPAFELPDLDGEAWSLDRLTAAEAPMVMVFIDPDCGPCNVLLPEIGQWQREHSGAVRLAVIGRGGVDANRTKAAEHGVRPFLLQRNYEVADLYLVYGTPGAVLVRPDGTIGSPVAGGPEQIRSMMGHLLGGRSSQPWVPPRPLPMLDDHAHPHGHDHAAQPTGPKIGEAAHAFALRNLDGDVVELADLRGSETLLLFWSPTCGFCQQMLPNLKAWEVERSAQAPTLVVVSGGTVAENRVLGLQATVVLDQTFETGQAFGADGTPSAVLIDPDGRIASGLAVGAVEVLALADASQRQPDPSTSH